MLPRSPERWKELALSYSPLAAVVWGLLLTLQAFHSPLETEWADWWVSMVIGMLVVLVVPLALAFGAAWIAARRQPRHQE